MKLDQVTLEGLELPVYSIDTVVIGTGCAGFNAADWLYDLGRRDIAIVTEGVKMGTSRNTGSDKQTYYKLSLASDGEDSVREMADTLFASGSVNGDTALIEAACSVKSFIKLANLGVPFPTNVFGEYVGYKTDHDPRQRATSAGPLTSKFMTECLEKSVNRKNITILDHMQVVKLLVEDNAVRGLLCIDTAAQTADNMGFVLIHCSHVIMATGGPAGVYYTSVYPESQTGATGMALEAGAKGVNLQEWQYGLASVKFRWNVSGTYQQVLPKFIAVDKNGSEREFLLDYFDDPKKAIDMVFLKGYQWPFDVAKVNGSSMIDIIVHHEIFDKGNRVFMDFRSEPTGLEDGFEGLSDETVNYLRNSNALISLPIQRLARMNKKAIELYQAHGIDLYSEPLEVSVCAQHNNGGIGVDLNWETSVQGLYVAGEAAGTFGVYRPGGSALNSTQVGSMRAAEHIACTGREQCGEFAEFAECAKRCAREVIVNAKKVMDKRGKSSNVVQLREETQKGMSNAAAHIRRPDEIKKVRERLCTLLDSFYDEIEISSAYELPHVLKSRDILITQLAVLSAIEKSAQEIGSRGSGLIISKNGKVIMDSLSDFSYAEGKKDYGDRVIATQKTDGKFISAFEAVRPIPQKDDWFETVWNAYMERTKQINQI